MLNSGVSRLQTYVNDSRIPAEIPVQLDHNDSLTFGDDILS